MQISYVSHGYSLYDIVPAESWPGTCARLLLTRQYNLITEIQFGDSWLTVEVHHFQ